MAKKPSADQPRATTLRKMGSSAPEARDEGPRLLPLATKKPSLDEYSRRFLELADMALETNKKPASQRAKRLR